MSNFARSSSVVNPMLGIERMNEVKTERPCDRARLSQSSFLPCSLHQQQARGLGGALSRE